MGANASCHAACPAPACDAGAVPALCGQRVRSRYCLGEVCTSESDSQPHRADLQPDLRPDSGQVTGVGVGAAELEYNLSDLYSESGPHSRGSSPRVEAAAADPAAPAPSPGDAARATTPPSPVTSGPEPSADAAAGPASEGVVGEQAVSRWPQYEDESDAGESNIGSEDSVGTAYSASSVASGDSLVRGAKRRQAKRLLVTHTMGLQPSSALQLIIESSADIHTHYTLASKALGEGAFGVVRKAKLKATGAIRAVKILSKDKLKDQNAIIKQEIEIMKQLDHPNLLMLYEVLEDDKKLYLVLELCSGGSLQDHLIKTGCLSETMAAVVIQQIIRATLYLHKNRICHRDLKADNCLISKSGALEQNILKVADFGLSCVVEPGKPITKVAGTPTHMAPEVFAKRYSLGCDMWSCGVIAHVLLSGYLPFTGANKEELIDKITRKSLEFATTEWLKVSQMAVDFVGKLLAKSPRHRITPSQALQDKWLKDRMPKIDVKLPLSVIDDLRNFRSKNRFKRAALHVVASMLKEDDIREMRKAFISLDRDGDGFFTISELKDCLRSHIFTGQSAEALVNRERELAWTSDETDGFTYTEFIAATFDMRKAAQEGLCQAAFSTFDKNRDGLISISELATGKMLGQLMLEEIVETMEALDVNGDASLDYGEFLKMMRGQSQMFPS